MKKFIVFLLLLSFPFLGGCATLRIDYAINRYNKAATQFKLGDAKEKVLSSLLPTQKLLPNSSKKQSEVYKATNGDLIEIYYFRTGRQPDGLTTDDEFIPYIFTNNKLSAIGWTALGGAKSHGQVVQPAAQIKQTTIIE